MGNQISNIQSISSSPNKLDTKPVSELVDYIATHYILTMDFQSLTKLFDKEYCDKLVIITSDVINKHFTNMEIVYLAERIKNGDTNDISALEKDNFLFFEKEKLDMLDIQDHIKKKHICLGIAKFYIKIAHLFAAIVKTINPIYTYKDNKSNTIKTVTLFEKNTIPKDTPFEVLNYNICNNLVNALVNNEDYTDIRDYNEINIHPNACSINVNDKGETESLYDKPGIPEFEQLYYDDDYDFEKGTFNGMTKDTKEIYDADLAKFYTFFTGNTSMPEGIKSFKDIKLTDYHNSFECRGNGPQQMPVFQMPVRGKITDTLFEKYAVNLKTMIENANRNQNELTSVLDKLFTSTNNAINNETHIRINSSLTDEELQHIIVDTRSKIMNLYFTCEQNFAEGIQIYQAILKQKLIETESNQINMLGKISNKLSDEVKPHENNTDVKEINSDEVKPDENKTDVKPDEQKVDDK